ncbi:hypothetical protein [Aquimarina intermedia]|uniref:Uncharacterized protein n=1 Tax=Aquimarina intermedia TaxID=350814 RepID=A0A5S5CAG5_9FLAO|nr:hypothetical protein [Aquimarina intermedia]TYP76139.1 hypothetical protein BD809_102356 [Aquimarina intermedia]
MNLIYKYYACLLVFTSYTGFKLTNEDSRATIIFTIVFLLNLGIVLELLGIKVLSVNRYIMVISFIISFFAFYKYFTNKSLKEKMIIGYRSLGQKKQFIVCFISLVYTIFSAILFLKLL